MTSEKLKFLGSTISKVFRYFNKNVIQARLITFAIFISIVYNFTFNRSGYCANGRQYESLPIFSNNK